jgi:hypothetical protein
MFSWLRSHLHKSISLSDLRAVRRLDPSVQSDVAREVAGFINLVRLSDAMLPMFFEAARQDRHDAIRNGARSRSNPAWVVAALKESWCGAKLGKAHGALDPAAADAIVQEIEKFVFDPKYSAGGP